MCQLEWRTHHTFSPSPARFVFYPSTYTSYNVWHVYLSLSSSSHAHASPTLHLPVHPSLARPSHPHESAKMRYAVLLSVLTLALAAPAPAPSSYELNLDTYLFDEFVKSHHNDKREAAPEPVAEPAPSNYALNMDTFLFDEFVKNRNN